MGRLFFPFLILICISISSKNTLAREVILPFGAKVQVSRTSGDPEKSDFVTYTLNKAQKISHPKGAFITKELTLYLNHLSYISLADVCNIHTSAGNLKVKDKILFYRDSGRLFECTLAENQRVKTPLGNLTIRGKVRFYENGSLEMIYTSEPVTVNTKAGNILTKSIIMFHPNGKIKYIGVHSGNPQSIITADGKAFTKYNLSFHSNGNLVEAWYKKPLKIKTEAGDIETDNLSFYDDGSVKSAYLNTSHALSSPAGDVFGKGRIYFYRNGRVKDIPAYGKSIRTSAGQIKVSRISFYEKGSLKYVYINETQALRTDSGTVRARANSKIGFHKNGKIKYISLYGRQRIKTPIGKQFIRNDLAFYENGKIKKVTLTDPVMQKLSIGRVVLKPSPVTFHPEGNIRSCNLNKFMIIKTPIGKIQIGKYIAFTKDGKLWRFTPSRPVKVRGRLYGSLHHLQFNSKGQFEGEVTIDF